MFQTILKVVMVLMMFMMFACSEEDNGSSSGGGTAIIDATITYAKTQIDTATSEAPMITATDHTLMASHFGWSITAGNNLVTINTTTGIITITDPKITVAGTVEVMATFNNTYTEGTLDTPLTTTVTIQRGSDNKDISTEEPIWDGITETEIIPTTDGIYGISRPSHLVWVASAEASAATNYFKDKTIKFIKDIDMDNQSFGGIGVFYGTIDGNGKRIFNLNIGDKSRNDAGLINVSNGTVVINNLTIFSGKIIGDVYVGSFVGKANDNLIIKNCINNATVTGSGSAGGLVGTANLLDSSLTIDNSSNTGTIKSRANIGGLVGRADDQLTIDNSFNTGTIIGNNQVGGLVGLASDYGETALTNVFSYAETITGTTNIGGLVGKNDSANLTIKNSYWLKVPNIDKALGNGSITASSNPKELTADEFKDTSNFKDWDFTKIWEFVTSNALYPTLQDK